MNGRFSAIALLLIATSSVAGMAQVNGNEIVASATTSSVTQNKDLKSRYKPKLGSYRNLELSEMDYFYTGNAVRIVVK